MHHPQKPEERSRLRGAHLDVLMKSGATVSLEANRGEDVAGFVDAISGQLGAATA